MPADTTTPFVLIAEEIDDECSAWLSERCKVEFCPSTDPARIETLLARADGLVVRTYTKVERGFLSRAPRLRVVGRAGVGLDNIDIAACRGRGVEVVHTPDANTRAVVELVTAFMLDALRPRVYVDRPLPLEEWKRLRHGLIAPRQLAGMTLGILGFGRVGSAMARVGAALDMRVIYNDVRDIPAESRFGAQPVRAEEVFASADIVTVHIDDRPSNARFVGTGLIGRMRADALFINASRGFVIDTAALAAFLRANPDAAAMLDVHDPEPFGPEYPLLGLSNARLTPHIGAATAAAHRNMSWVVRDVWRVLSGEKPKWPAAG